MADAGGVVYLLSSYQSGKGEVGAQRGGVWGVRERYRRKGGRLTERREHLVPVQLLLIIHRTVRTPSFDLPGFM